MTRLNRTNQTITTYMRYEILWWLGPGSEPREGPNSKQYDRELWSKQNKWGGRVNVNESAVSIVVVR